MLPDASTPRVPLTHSPTVRRLLYEAMIRLGLDPAAVYRRALRQGHLAPPSAERRLPHDEVPLFWETVESLSGDPDIGLHLAEAMTARLLDVVGYLLLASRDLGEALQSFLRFQHILSGGLAAQLREEGERVRLIVDIHYQGYAPMRQQMECLVLLFIKLLRLVSDDEFHCLAIDFRHPQPRRLGEHRRLFGLTPAFACAHDALVFPRALLARPSRTANPVLHALLSRHAEEELQRLRGNDLLNRLRYLLGLRLGREPCTLAACAQVLGMSAGALQRALAAQGSSFRELHEEARRQRAVELLAEPMAIREVARACGFAELSPFYRAFRRWYGEPPERFRRRLAERPAS
ncbi:AraC family transcriptional regulator [Pseudomonas citronellolis]|uniref:AraC family transcriptional regulator n=1 Tax=Pseudomonas citronellolis TaxID=53408 RepID=UPI0023E3FDC4|nr:AraC family transcriptional regulator [Pseudomonas citronellolis]MDF3932578.1 AraC family transcriptional regulator [Pseudomonas citronellolis]